MPVRANGRFGFCGQSAKPKGKAVAFTFTSFLRGIALFCPQGQMAALRFAAKRKTQRESRSFHFYFLSKGNCAVLPVRANGRFAFCGQSAKPKGKAVAFTFTSFLRGIALFCPQGKWPLCVLRPKRKTQRKSASFHFLSVCFSVYRLLQKQASARM